MTLGLLFTALALGVRHGVDWDHIAAITDLTSSSETRRRGFVLSLLYAIGHGAVVFLLGLLAIAFGSSLPAGVDEWMGRVVGATLLILGVWVLVQLVRHGREFRLRSRWMLVLRGTFAGVRRVRHARAARTIGIEHAHEHEHGEVDDNVHDHAHVDTNVYTDVDIGAVVGAPTAAGAVAYDSAPQGAWWGHFTSHRHRHHHDLPLPEDPFASYGGPAATGIGMLHGVGIESPTQIAVFVAATSASGTGSGLLLLAAWIGGLIAANAALAALAAFGLLHAERSFSIYATIAVVVAVGSIVMGTLLMT